MICNHDVLTHCGAHIRWHEVSLAGNQGKGPFLYYVRVKGWVGGIAKFLLFLTGVGGWFWITLT